MLREKCLEAPARLRKHVKNPESGSRAGCHKVAFALETGGALNTFKFLAPRLRGAAAQEEP